MKSFLNLNLIDLVELITIVLKAIVLLVILLNDLSSNCSHEYWSVSSSFIHAFLTVKVSFVFFKSNNWRLMNFAELVRLSRGSFMVSFDTDRRSGRKA